MKAEIITIGDEILIGQIVNTNAAWLANALTEIGVECVVKDNFNFVILKSN